MQVNVINPILNAMCDQPAAGGTVGGVLRGYNAIHGANHYFAPYGWWTEATIQETFFRYIQALGVANYLCLAEQYYGGPAGQRSDIMVVDVPNNEVLGIEIKSTFDISDTEDDIDKLGNLLANQDIHFGIAIFTSTNGNFANWLAQLTQYSQQTTGGAIDVGGVHS